MRTGRSRRRVQQYRMRAERLSCRVEQQECPFIKLGVTEDESPHVGIDPQWNESSTRSGCTDPFRLVRNITRVDALDSDPTRIAVASVVHRLEQRSEIRIGVKSHHGAAEMQARWRHRPAEKRPSPAG